MNLPRQLARIFTFTAFAYAFSTATYAQEKVAFAYFKTTSIIPFLYAKQKGYFKSEGIDLEMIPVQAGPAAAAAIASGTAQLGYAASAPIITARSQSQPFKFIIGLDWEQTPGTLYDAMLASKRSGIKTFRDVIGKTIVMNAPGSLCELAWRDWLAKNDIEWSQVKVLTSPFPQNQAMLELGTADAVCSAPPFIDSLKASKVAPVVLGSGFLAKETRRYLMDGVFASDAWIASNTKTIAAIKRGLAKGANDLKGDKEALHKILVDEYRLPPAIAESTRINLNPVIDVDAKDILPVLQAMEKYGMVKPGLSAGDMVADVK